MDLLSPSNSQVGLEIWINLPSSTWQLLWNTGYSVQGCRDSNDIDSVQQRTHNSYHISPKICRIYIFPIYKHCEILHSMWMSCFYPILIMKCKERSMGSLKDSLLQQDARGSLDWRKANLHNQAWWISFDCCHFRSCKSNSPTAPKQTHKVIYTDLRACMISKRHQFQDPCKPGLFAKNNPFLLALLIMSIDSSNSASDFNEYPSRASACLKCWAENTGFAFHPQTVLLFTVTDFHLLGKVLLRQKFLGAFKYSLPSITGKGAVHVVNLLSRIALLKQWPAICQLTCTREKSCHLCSIWHLNLSEELLLSPAGKQWISTQQSDSLNKGSPGRILSQPTVIGKCPSRPPRHEHFQTVCYHFMLHMVWHFPTHLPPPTVLLLPRGGSRSTQNMKWMRGKVFNKIIFSEIFPNPHQSRQAGRILLERLGNMADWKSYFRSHQKARR